MSILSLLGGCDDTSADGPDWLVGNDDLAPVAHLLFDCVKLSCVDGIGLSSFTLVEFLTNASHYAEILIEGDLDLLGDDLVALTKDVTSLAMSKDDPVEAELLNHVGTGLSSVGSVSVKRAVLCGNLNL